MAGQTGNWLKNLAKISTYQEEHLETRVEKRSHDEVEEQHIQAEGSSSVLQRLRCIPKGRKRGRLGSHHQHKHSNAAKLKKTKYTKYNEKTGITEYDMTQESPKKAKIRLPKK